MDPLSRLPEIMQRRGVRCTPSEFQSIVNIVFHRFESEVYDTNHRNMWDSLPPIFAKFAEDCREAWGRVPDELRVLDIGCGTGLASDSVLKSCLGPVITHIDLLDTSPAMLARVEQRAKSSWKVPVTCREGLIDDVPDESRYDLIVTCSVLHHVPDLGRFTRHVRRLQAPRGIFLHLQDPNGDHLNDPELKRRTDQLTSRALPRFAKRVIERIQRTINDEEGSEQHVGQANAELVRMGVLQTPMTIAEMYTITDIHVQDGQGISITQMGEWLPEYRLISERSYGFFGQLHSDLPPKFQEEEARLISSKAPNGFHVGAAWQLR
jgi:2-polyprenyl-3-methyl-5-hydroxy-6-metoxy-1,4-benzoquinol methylase